MSAPLIGLQCTVCLHLVGIETADPVNGLEGASRIVCGAFPTGIPAEILEDRFDHRQPHEGDHGIQWAPAMPGLTHPKA